MEGGEETHPLEPFLRPHSRYARLHIRHSHEEQLYSTPYSLETLRVYSCTVPSSVFPPFLRPSWRIPPHFR